MPEVISHPPPVLDIFLNQPALWKGAPLRKFSTFLPQFTRGVEESKWGEYCILAGTIQYLQPLYAKWMT
ncbi:MAG: hypothetical protein A2156_08160 [Deltaproteobacteria bacterium RBG_16_48_10]|nr:MAG: hypothetical protein A2156_08160 [Deltaproteobacteria bacterium RBG_16_48_10]